MKGCYCLIINLDETSEIEIGKLGKVNFNNGYYIYVGSAMNSLKARINRHLSDDKKIHWHIDYMLKNDNAEISEVIYNVSDKKIECMLSQQISQKSEGIENFGCSDCNCESHLYYFKTKKEAIECVKNAYDSIAMDYEFFKI
ncbi:MAG: GIY-YIG nuclease family protein [Methanobrevibacter sp.]